MLASQPMAHNIHIYIYVYLYVANDDDVGINAYFLYLNWIQNLKLFYPII